ncbi:Ribonuclease D [Planctomycetales bacterium 10988]|nr:Ribonuclease D [Planctomycetales bacterium 10988]
MAAQSSTIAFDTEFVSEHSYRPVLCLVQVALPDQLFILDPFEIPDLNPFWELIASPDRRVIVHAGREEVNFCMHAIDKLPSRLIDVQLAAGMVGMDYPAGYSTLVQRFVGKTPGKGETRSDWRRRPLSPQQLRYASDDVRYLIPLADHILKRVEELERSRWLEIETEAWLQDVAQSKTRERWRNVSGSGGLSGRSLAILRELWRWRESEAERRDSPPRRIIRDDLISEIARRQLSDPKRLGTLRGMDRSDVKRYLPDLIQCVEHGLSVPPERVPTKIRKAKPPQLTMLGQFLASAVTSICREKQIAPSLVGNPTDVRDFITYRLNPAESEEPPQLCRGWRAELIGSVLADLLEGRMTIRIEDPRSDQPLAFEKNDSETI